MSNNKIFNFNYLQFIDFVEKTPRSVRSAEKGYNASGDVTAGAKYNDNGSDWYGSKSFKEALGFAKYGWEAGIKQMEEIKELVIDGGTEFENQVYGSYVDVGRFANGSPDCMINFITEIEAPKQELTIYCNLSYNAGTSGKDAVNYCKRINEIVNVYGSKYALRIIGFFPTSTDVTSIVFITIKEPEERLVLNSVAYAFHPSFFRRLWFKWLETTDFCSSSYGSADSENASNNYCMEHASSQNIKDFWLLPSLQHNGWKCEDTLIKRYKNSVLQPKQES
jgi:hypothetical protein